MNSGTRIDLDVERVVLLPQPRNLHALATRSTHFHMGCFDGSACELDAAMDRMILRAEPYLRPSSLVVDLGCGLGGSSELIADRGHRCIGIDPCGQCIAFARSLGTAACRFETLRVEDLDRSWWGRFDAAVLIESLQFHVDLPRLLGGVCSLLRPGGRIVLADLTACVPIDFLAVPFHRRNRRAEAARMLGLRTIVHEDLTAAVAPTFPLLKKALSDLDMSSLAVTAGRCLRRDRAELQLHCEHLAAALHQGELVYEFTVLEKAAA